MSKALAMRNNSFQVVFILLGFTKWPHLQIILFWIMIILYAMIILSNSTIILLSCVDIRLYTSMYFFLSNLSFLDLCFTTTSVPQVLYNLWGPDKSIPYTGLVIQLCVPLPWCNRRCYVGDDGLWPLYCYLPASALYHHHESSVLLETGANSLTVWTDGICNPIFHHIPASFMQPPPPGWFSVRSSCLLTPSMWRYLSHWVANDHLCWPFHHHASGTDPDFLWLYSSSLGETPARRGKEKSHCHLFFPPYCGLHVLWDSGHGLCRS